MYRGLGALGLRLALAKLLLGSARVDRLTQCPNPLANPGQFRALPGIESPLYAEERYPARGVAGSQKAEEQAGTAGG